MEKRYYYKKKNGTTYWSLKTPDKPEGAVEITEEEWNAHQKELDGEQ